jgi:hypothetical protein
MKIFILICVSFIGLNSISAHLIYSEDNVPKKTPSRSKSLDFEGDLIEGVNKRPLDSLNQVSEANKKRKRPHLYNKKSDYHLENAYKLKEMRHSQ